jgi:hypothetical protein
VEFLPKKRSQLLARRGVKITKHFGERPHLKFESAGTAQMEHMRQRDFRFEHVRGAFYVGSDRGAGKRKVRRESYFIEWFHRYKLENSRTRLAKSQCVPGTPGLESPICFQWAKIQ